MKIISVIPAALTDDVPQKLLQNETGKPLIVHTIEASQKHFETVVATDSSEIYNTVREYCVNVPVVLTGTCSSGTDRVRRAIHFLEQFTVQPHFDVVINWQANVPEMDCKCLANAVKELTFFENDIITFAANATPKDIASPDVVKIVKDHQGHALYFSRSPIPHGAEHAYKHIGVYIFRRDILASLDTLDDTMYPSEKLEQLQWLEAGLRVVVYACPCPITQVGISTPEQYRGFVERNAL